MVRKMNCLCLPEMTLPNTENYLLNFSGQLVYPCTGHYNVYTKQIPVLLQPETIYVNIPQEIVTWFGRIKKHKKPKQMGREYKVGRIQQFYTHNKNDKQTWKCSEYEKGILMTFRRQRILCASYRFIILDSQKLTNKIQLDYTHSQLYIVPILS